MLIWLFITQYLSFTAQKNKQIDIHLQHLFAYYMIPNFIAN